MERELKPNGSCFILYMYSTTKTRTGIAQVGDGQPALSVRKCDGLTKAD